MDAVAEYLPRRAALFLDFDGTLVALAERPELVRVPDGLCDLLHQVAQRLDGALAIVTGRRLDAVDSLLAPLKFAGAGVHGAELRRAADAGIVAGDSIDLGAATAAVRARFRDDPGILIEDKGAALAVHFRQRPHRGAEVEHALRYAVETQSVTIVAGKFVFEARPRGVSKGGALTALMMAPPFKGRLPVFVGDDVTDEDGIHAAQAQGGIGIKVGEGASGAIWRLENPMAVTAWLRSSLREWNDTNE